VGEVLPLIEKLGRNRSRRQSCGYKRKRSDNGEGWRKIDRTTERVKGKTSPETWETGLAGGSKERKTEKNNSGSPSGPGGTTLVSDKGDI